VSHRSLPRAHHVGPREPVGIWFLDVYGGLVGGFNNLEKYEFVNGKDDIPYMKWKRKHVPNHQPVVIKTRSFIK